MEQQQSSILHFFTWCVRKHDSEEEGGLQQIDFKIEEALTRYTHDNFIGGVDDVDEDKKIRWGFH